MFSFMFSRIRRRWVPVQIIRKLFVLVIVVVSVVLCNVLVTNVLRVDSDIQISFFNSAYLKWPEEECKPQTNIIFLKTHKCASSTIQNILFRYGDRHNLTFALPAFANYFGHPEPFNRSFVANNWSRTFNILTHHTRYNRKEMDLLTSNKSAYITIVRSPVDLLESLYTYYNFKTYLNMDLENMTKNSFKGLYRLGYTRFAKRIGLNQMSFDLGLDESEFDNETIVRNFIDRIDAEFDLVMIYERMEESLVLLSDLLCWPLEDVAGLKLNARKKSLINNMTAELKNKIEEINPADVLLYQHFQKRFEERVRAYGVDKMAAKVGELINIIDDLNRRCIGRIKTKKDVKDLYAPFIVEYEIRNTSDFECQRMMTYDLVYTDILRMKHGVKLIQQGFSTNIPKKEKSAGFVNVKNNNKKAIGLLRFHNISN